MGKGTSDSGFTLVEIVVVLMVAGILFAIAIPNVTMRLRRMGVQGCAQKLASDLRYARISAQTQGHRAQLVIPQDGLPHDLTGDGRSELWLTFLDSYPNPTASYALGKTALSCGTCDKGITIISSTTPVTSPLDNGVTGPMGVDNRSMWFSSIGTLKSNNVDKTIVFANQSDSSYKVRLKIMSMSGYTKVQLCQATDCTIESNWKDL